MVVLCRQRELSIHFRAIVDKVGAIYYAILSEQQIEQCALHDVLVCSGLLIDSFLPIPNINILSIFYMLNLYYVYIPRIIFLQLEIIILFQE